MAVDWGKMAKTQLNGDSWEESIALFKLSNVLGFNLSNVLGFYFSNYGFMKTQLMLGLERKINLAPKYEWYYTAPTKVLVAGENKIDVGDYKKVRNYDWKIALKRAFTTSQDEIKAFNTDLKTANKNETIAGPSETTCASHTLTVNLGNSTESIAVGNKNIMATTVIVDGKTGVALSSGAASIAVSTASVTVSGPVINLG